MLVLKVPCSRCARVEEKVVSPDQAQAEMSEKKPPAVQVKTSEGEEFTLNRLCSPCQDIVGKLLTKAFTQIEGRKSGARKAKSQPAKAKPKPKAKPA